MNAEHGRARASEAREAVRPKTENLAQWETILRYLHFCQRQLNASQRVRQTVGRVDVVLVNVRHCTFSEGTAGETQSKKKKKKKIEHIQKIIATKVVAAIVLLAHHGR